MEGNDVTRRIFAIEKEANAHFDKVKSTPAGRGR